jgi:vacuolar-type H+-ATPase subunit H
VGVIGGYIISVFSALFSMYKFRMLVLERMRELNSNGIKPTLKRIIFLERTLADHSKLLPDSERADAACIEMADSSGADNEISRTVDDLRARMDKQQETFENRFQQMQQQQQQQQQQQVLQEQYEKIMASMQRQIQELRSQLQHPKHDQ